LEGWFKAASTEAKKTEKKIDKAAHAVATVVKDMRKQKVKGGRR
jgi:hypothetical protein